MNKELMELHARFEELPFVKSEKENYKVEFDYGAPPFGIYVDKTNNRMRQDCCYYLRGAWRMYREMNGVS